MVEVVGTAPTSAMVITKFVYRHSWKTNSNNINEYNKFSTIYMNINKKYLLLVILVFSTLLPKLIVSIIYFDNLYEEYQLITVFNKLRLLDIFQ